jgi:hypothetical protein
VSEPIIIRGRPSFGIAMNLAYGLVCFIGGLALFIGEYKTSDYCWLAFFLLLIIFGAILLSMAIYEARTRTLEIDDNGIRFRIGNRLDWDVPWVELRVIGTDALKFRYPRTGFFLGTEKNMHHINNRDHLGPEKMLVTAFRAIALKAAGPNVVCYDWLGWAADMRLDFGLPKEMMKTKKLEPGMEGIVGNWQNSRSPYSSLKYFLICALIIFILGGLSLLPKVLWSGTIMIGDLDNVIVGGCLIATGVIIMLFGFNSYSTTPTAVKFDPHTISLRFPFGKIIEKPWEKVSNLGVSYSTGALGVSFAGDKYLTEGVFDTKVVEAVRFFYSQARDVKEKPNRPA